MPSYEHLSTSATSESLLARVKRHDGEAWHRLSDMYGPMLYGWARRARLQDSDAADVVQETFRAVATSIPH